MKHPNGLFRPVFRICPAPSGGFTLVEMLTVIALTAIMASVALPNFSGLITRYRVAAKANSLQASLSFARAEAIRRGANVSVKSRGTACSLGKRDKDWSCGWDVQVDSGDILKSENPDEKAAITSDAAVVSFDGFGRSSQWGCFDVKPEPEGGRSSTIQVIFSQGGLMRRQADGKCARDA